MIDFKCSFTNGSDKTKWSAGLFGINSYSSHFEAVILAQSDNTFRLLVGKTLTGNFVCFPDLKLSCHLGALKDVHINTRFLSHILNVKDSITIANGIRKVAEIYDYYDSDKIVNSETEPSGDCPF